MDELLALTKALGKLSFRYCTLRGKISDMPESMTLCAVLGILSILGGFVSTYISDSLEMAIAVPFVWLSAVWLFASSESGSWRIDPRVASSVFLVSLPMEMLVASMGRGNQLMEVPIGFYAAVCILTLRGRE